MEWEPHHQILALEQEYSKTKKEIKMFGTLGSIGSFIGKGFKAANDYSNLIGAGVGAYSAYSAHKQGKESLNLQKQQHALAIQDRQDAAQVRDNEMMRLKRQGGITKRFQGQQGYGGYSVKNRLNELAGSQITLG